MELANLEQVLGEKRNLLLSKENVSFPQLLVQAGGNWVHWGWDCSPNLKQFPQAKQMELGCSGSDEILQGGAVPAAYQAPAVT